MIPFSFLDKMNVKSFSNAWKRNLTCEECSIRLNFLRKKKICYLCKNSFCQVCIMRQEDTKFCCRKCQILTARPLDKNELLNLRSRDLMNYLASRHISTNGCVEKEDLVNVLIRAVNNSCLHPSTSTPFDGSYCANSYPNTPRNNSFAADQSNAKRRLSLSVENLFNEDGIRIRGHNETQDDVLGCRSDKTEVDDIQTQINKTGESSQSVLENNDEDKFSSLTPRTDDAEISSEGALSHSNLDNVGQKKEPLVTNKPLMLSDIKDSSDLNALSIKQLKELLMRNRYDFKGCIERTELLQKANRLWSDYVVSRRDLDNLSLEELCKICMDAPIECVLLECGHMATCTSCGKQLCECPICRRFVVRCVRTYKA